MSVSELVQLYAPLAGLLVLAFWVGGLGQRVKGLEMVAKDNKEMEKAMIRLVVLVEQQDRTLSELAGKLAWLTSVPPVMPTPPRNVRRRQGSDEKEMG
jgi:hypothetical protein